MRVIIPSADARLYEAAELGNVVDSLHANGEGGLLVGDTVALDTLPHFTVRPGHDLAQLVTHPSFVPLVQVLCPLEV